MTNVWIYKADGTRQCETGGEITLDKMHEELAMLIGGANVVSSEKRILPMMNITLCGAPTGSVNAYEITEIGAYILFKGFIGPDGFAFWPWGTDQKEGLSDGFTLGEHKLSGDGDIFPVSLLNGAEGADKNALFLNLISSLTQSGVQPSLISELNGRQCRCYKSGDALTLDYIPSRVNIELSKERLIQRIWFG